MTTVSILGGYGQTGLALAGYLLDWTDCDLILIGRRPDKGHAVADELNRLAGLHRVAFARADAADTAGLTRALAGSDLVIIASSTATYAEQVARAALAAGVDYLDIQYSADKLAVLRRLAPEIERAGRCFITDGGFHPGLPAALVRYAASRFDYLERANVGSVISVDWASLDLSRETTEEFVREFIGFESRVFRDGQWRDLSAAAMLQPMHMEFGPRFGRRTCIPMALTEMNVLPEMLPSLRETGFFVGGFNPFTDWVITPLVIAALKLSPGRMISPMARLLFWSMARGSRPPFGTQLRLDAAGRVEGISRSLTIDLLHEDGYAFTAIPVVACVRQWLTGEARRPGLWWQGLIVEPERMMDDMARMGVKIAVETDAEMDEPHLNPTL